MKKSFLTLVLLLAVTALSAQTLIETNLQKGDRTTYEAVADVRVNTPISDGSESTKTNSKIKITVQDATADGYIIEVLAANMKMEGGKKTTQQAGNMLNQYLSNVSMLPKMGTNRKVKDLLNYIEVQTRAGKSAVTFIDSLYNANPEMEKVLLEYKMTTSMNSQFIKEALIESVEYNTFFQLFGKALKTDDKEDKNIQGIKTTVVYEFNRGLNALNIIGKTKSSMIGDDVKAFLINKMGQMGTDEGIVSQLGANWGQMKQMGIAGIDVDGTSMTKFLSTGWVTEYSTDVKTKMMGMEMLIASVTKLVEESWK